MSNKCLYSILSLSICRSDLAPHDEGPAIIDSIQEILDLAERHNGHLVSALYGDLVIVFGATSLSEKHTERAYAYYSHADDIVSKYDLELRAVLHTTSLLERKGVLYGNELNSLNKLAESGLSKKGKGLYVTSSAASFLGDRICLEEVRGISKKLGLRLFRASSNSISPQRVQLFSGRKIELEILKSAMENGRHISVVGAAGVGKTTLVEYFLNKHSIQHLKLSFSESGHESILCSLFDALLIKRSMDVHCSFRDKAIDIAKILDLNENQTELLQSFYQKPYLSTHFLRSGRGVLLACIKELSRNNGLCLFIDDIHWSKDGFDEFISELINSIPKIKVISTSRCVNKKNGAHDVINLKPLNKGEMKDIVFDSLPYDLVSDDFIDQLYDKTSGNPFYVCEYLQTLNLARQRSSSELLNYQVLDLDSDIKVPMRLANLIAFQIGQLTAECLSILKICACLGENIRADDVCRIANGEREEVSAFLDELCRRDFIKFNLRAQSYEFIHSIKREAVYKNILPNKRSRIHEMIAKYFFKQGRSPMVSTHLFYAQLWRDAYRENLYDAKEFLKNIEPQAAMEALMRCRICAEKMGCLSNIRKLRISLMICKTLFIFGEVNAAEKMLLPIKDLFSNDELQKYPNVWNEALNELTFYYWIVADYVNALKVIDQAEKNYAHMISPSTAGALRIRRIGVYSDTGRITESNKLIDEILDSYKSQGDFEKWKSVFPVQAVLFAMRSRNNAYLRKKNVFEMDAYRALQAADNNKAVSTKIFSLCYVSDGYIQFGNYELARSLLSQASELMEQYRIYVLKGYILSMLGHCEAALGNEDGVFVITNAIQDSEKSGRICRLPLLYMYLIKSLLLLSLHSSVKRHVLKAIKLADQQGEKWVVSQLHEIAASKEIEVPGPKFVPRNNVLRISDYLS